MLNVSEHPSIRKGRAANIAPISTADEAHAIERKRMEAWLAERINSDTPIMHPVTLTPMLAALLLERNKDNRPISATNLDRLKSDIIGKRFAFNGEAIIVSSSGELNDGQHRCMAVRETGVSIETAIVFGVERQTRLTLDQGAIRTSGHFLAMIGFSDSVALGAAASLAWQYRTHNKLSQKHSDRPTKAQVTEFLTHYRDLADSLRHVYKDGITVLGSRSMLAFCHWAFARVDQAGADIFLDKLFSGAGLSEGSPILYCRNRLLEMKGLEKSGPNKVEIIFKCWNAWKRGETIKFVRVNGGQVPELER